MADLNNNFTDQKPEQNLQIDFLDQKQDQGLRIDFADQPKMRVAKGISEAWTAGYQGSVPGLVDRGKMPDIVLDPSHSKWYEKLVAGASQMVNEAPEMAVGAIGGAAAGAAVSGPFAPVGAVVGGGAAAFAVPTAIRQSLIEAYSKGEVTSAGDFLSRAAIVLGHTAKDAAVGGLTSGAGMVTSRLVGGMIAPMIGEQIGVKTGMAAIGTAGAAAEIGTMTVAPALMEGRLPEADDFMNAAIMVAGLKGAHTAAAKFGEIYAKTGARPEQVVAAAKNDPILAEQLKSTEPGLPEAYKAAAAEQNAVDAVTGVKVEAVREQPFADVPQAAGEPAQPTHINYNYINTTEDAKGALSRLSQIYETEIQTQRRGTVPWEQTQAEAGAILADMLGSTEPFLPREPGTAAGAAELLARKQMVVGAAEDMATRAREYADLGTNASPEQTAAFLASIDRAAMIHSEFLRARAEAGRALNILKETKSTAERSQQISELILRFGKDPVELAQMIKELDNPASALKFARDAVKASTWDKVVEAWKAALVSGPITQIANIFGNATFTALRPAVDAVAATVGALRGNAERVSAVEPLGRVFGNLEGIKDGLKMAWSALKEDSTPAGKSEHKHAIPGTTGYVVRFPFRMLSAGDMLFREITKRGELYAQATRDATRDGFNPATREFRERVAELVMNPSEKMESDAADAALRFTFNSPLAEKGKAVQNFVKEWHLEWAVPFISTPANVFKETARLTPFAPIVGEWRKAIAAGGAEADKAVAELALGAGIMALTVSYALGGNVSGAGDPDPNKRHVKMASGWQPYSIKVGDTWHNYQRIQPLGTVLGLAADMAEAWQHMTPEESDKLPKMLSVAFANAVTNTTFLKGVTSLVQVMADPNRYGGKFVQDMASSVVPGALGQVATAFDPYVREVDSMKQAIMNRVPGLREQLMPARDVYGEKVANKERLGGVSPITTVQESDDKVRLEAARLEVGAPKAPKTVQMPAAGDRKLGQIELTAQQKDVFADVGGHMAYEALKGIVNSPGWDEMPDMIKKRAYQIAFDKGHAFGKNAALSSEDRQREIVRITSEIAKRLGK